MLVEISISLRVRFESSSRSKVRLRLGPHLVLVAGLPLIVFQS